MDYKTLSFRGPFPNRMDPFAEAARYFNQLHSGIIGEMVARIQPSLFDMGYVASKETSLQVADMRKPDLSVFNLTAHPPSISVDYHAAAEAILMEAGIAIEYEEALEVPEFEAIRIYNRETGAVVTVVEVISPSNKTGPAEMRRYREERWQLFIEKGVIVVEMDLTRSNQRLVDHVLTAEYPYHIALFIPGQAPRIIPMALNKPLKSFALPLPDNVLGIHLHEVYEKVYQDAGIPMQIELRGHYNEAYLPYPSLLSESDYHEIIQTVTDWHEELARLQAT